MNKPWKWALRISTSRNRSWVATLVALILLTSNSGAANNCPNLDGDIPVLSSRGEEAKLFRTILETIEQVTGRAPSSAELTRRFVHCLEATSAEAGTPVDPDSINQSMTDLAATLTVTEKTVATNGHHHRKVSLHRPPWTVAKKVTKLLLRELPPNQRGATNDLLWHLWVESAIALLDQPHASYTYSDQLAFQRATFRGKSFAPGFWPELIDHRVLVGIVWDQDLIKGGLASGDEVAAINGQLIQSGDLDHWLRSEPAAYTITVLKGQQKKIIKAHTVPFRHQTLRWQSWQGVVYARLSRFSTDSLVELRRMARRIDSDIKGLILDLRGNSGGRKSFDFVDCFLKPGQTVATTIDHQSGERRDVEASIEFFPWPLVVLVDHHSASMSEVFAAAIQTHGRGQIVGERTYGKSVGQTLYPVGDEGELNLVTMSMYYPGTELGWPDGIEPDVPIVMTDTMREKADALLDEASPTLDHLLEQDDVVQKALTILITHHPTGSSP